MMPWKCRDKGRLVAVIHIIWFVLINSVQWPSRGKRVYCLANILLMAYRTSRHINTIVCTRVAGSEVSG